MRTARCLACCSLLMLLVVFSGQASAVTTVNVGTCTSGVDYASIQNAVNAVSPGGTVRVCPGNYYEQVVITQPLTLQGIADAINDAAVILPPKAGMAQNAVDLDNSSLPIAAQILVENTTGVTISNLTIDGTGNGITSCSPDLMGILFQNASGVVNHVAVRNEMLGSGLGGCQSGEGIFVQTGSGLVSSVTVENSSVHNYNKNGITGHDAGTTVTATSNYVQGNGVVPSGGAAQNGIELAFGAAGKITSNTVIDNIYGDTTVADSADILLYDSAENASISLSMNTLGNSQLPIALVADTAGLGDGVTVSGNKIFGTSTADAIDVCTNGNTIKSNTITNSAQSAVHLDASCGTSFGGSTGNNNTVSANTILESACAGILLDQGVTGNTTSPDVYYTVPYTITGSSAHCTIPAGPAAAGVNGAVVSIGRIHHVSPAK